MNHLDLFSGIGGFALAARWAGIDTIGFCENDKQCQKALKKHWPTVPIEDDIRNLKGVNYGKIDIITGGYPCQPFSVAGSQKAAKDDRNFWPEMFRIITQIKPNWVVCENVYGHIRLGLDNVLHDLESVGYTSLPFVVPAIACGANHNRKRVFIVSNSASNGFDESEAGRSDEKTNEHSEKRPEEDSNNEGCSGLWANLDGSGGEAGGWRTEPPALRVDDGIPNRMDRNRMIGNSIVPQIAYQIFKAIIKG